MTTLKHVLTRTILPSIIAAFVLAAYGFIEERSTPARFEEPYYSKFDYLIFIITLATIASIFKLIGDGILGHRFKPTTRLITSILLMSSFFLVLFTILAVINGKFPGDIFMAVTLAVLALVTLIHVMSLAFGNFFIRKANS
jgi:hypothetical protein